MKVFQLNEHDTYMAETLEQAIECAISETGLDREDLVTQRHLREIPPEEMATRTLLSEDGAKMTFAESLAGEVKLGSHPRLFSSTEY